jgi:hypothetical protein
MMALYGNAEEVINCAYYLEEFALKKKGEQQDLLIQWIKYAEAMRRELGVSNQAAKVYILPGSNASMICGNALARLIGYSRSAWDTVKKAYTQKQSPKHALAGVFGAAACRTNAEHTALLHDFFQRAEAMAEPRATKIIRDIVGDHVETDLRGDENQLDLPAYISKLGLYKKLLAECQWRYSFNSKNKVIQREKLNDAEAKSVPSWSTFRRFWKSNYPLLVIQKPSEDICGECHKFANSYKTLNSRNKKKAAAVNSNSDDSSSDDEGVEDSGSVPDLGLEEADPDGKSI